MNAIINDPNALRAVTPAALSAYANAAGWAKAEPYGDYSDVYAGQSLPEIIIPRTQQLGDYALVVSQLIGIFARVAEVNETTLYHDLVTADRDVIRARVSEGAADGSVDIDSGVNLVKGARDLVLAAACSWNNPQPLHRTGAHREANDFLRRMRLGQTEHGSFVITLMTPTIPPPTRNFLTSDPEMGATITGRKVTTHLSTALFVARVAAERASGGDDSDFPKVVPVGVNANLCEALADMVDPFGALDISITWARTRPTSTARDTVRFTNDYAPILREAAQSYRNLEPQPDVQLFGSVHILRRDESESDGRVTIRASVNNAIRSVQAVLTQSDYHRAIQAHDKREPVIVSGDLERIGQRWHLHNPRLVAVISGAYDDPEDGKQ